jgi:hypothetical protein
MPNVDMHLLQINSDGTYLLYDSYATTYDYPPEDKDQGGTYDLSNIQTSTSGNLVTVSYERAFNTGDKYDHIISVGSKENLVLVNEDGAIAYHGQNRPQMFTFTLTADSGTSQVVNTTSQFDFWELHGILNIILWSVFNFFGYVSARFFKHLTWWIWVHRIGSAFTALVSIGIVGAAINLCTYLIISSFSL